MCRSTYFIGFFLLFCSWMSQPVRAQDQWVYKSKYLPQPDTTWVFQPKVAAVQKKLPVVFLLHGYSGNYKQWHQIMDAQRYADEYGFLVVCPDGLYSSWYLNSPVKADLQFETFFFEELLPDIKKNYVIDESNLFITGLSMGGHGALHLFIQRPDLFKSAGSTSGGVRLSDGFGKYGLGEVLGNPPKESALWQKYAVLSNLHRLEGIEKPFIFDCGSGDFFYEANNLLKEKADELKLPATYISQPGAHNRAYWKKSIRQHFDFFKGLMSVHTE